MTHPHDAVDEQFDTDGGRQTIEFGDISASDFDRYAIPYTVGYASAVGYGVADISYTEKEIVVAPLAGE